jgi:Zn ribbon nucleic-acid-binding protein
MADYVDCYYCGHSNDVTSDEGWDEDVVYETECVKCKESFLYEARAEVSLYSYAGEN